MSIPTAARTARRCQPWSYRSLAMQMYDGNRSCIIYYVKKHVKIRALGRLMYLPMSLCSSGLVIQTRPNSV